MCSKLPCWFLNILGDPGADSGGEGKSKRAKKCGTKKSKERREEPLATLWNWSGKTLSPGALLAVLYFSSFHIYFSARLDFPSPPSSAPGSRRMVFEQRNLPMSILPKSLLLAQAMFKLYKHFLRKGIIQKVS